MKGISLGYVEIESPILYIQRAAPDTYPDTYPDPCTE